MKSLSKTLLASLLTLCIALPDSPADILLNEVHIDPPGSDEGGNFEYIELLSTTGGAEATDGLAILLIDSNNGGYGRIRKRWSLNGYATGSNGLLLLGNNYPTSVPYADVPPQTALADPATPDAMLSGDLGSNGGFTLFLVSGFNLNIPIDTDLDSDDDGDLDATPWSDLLDSVGFDDTDPTDPPDRQTYSLADLSQPNYFPENASRIAADARGNTAGAWYGGVIPSSGDGRSFDPDRTFNGFPGAGATPGRPNTVSETADLRLNEISLNPNGNDENLEFIEILSVSGGREWTNGYHVVLIANDPAEGDLGVIEQAWDLAGLQTGDNGLLLLGDGYAKPAPGKLADTPFKTFVDPATEAGDPPSMGRNEIEPTNGLSILLVTEFASARGVDLDHDNDGVLDVSPWEAIVDSVGFDNLNEITGDISRTYAPARLAISGFYPDNISRVSGDLTANSHTPFYGGDYGGDSQVAIGFDEKHFLPEGVALSKLRATPGRRNLHPDDPPYSRDILLNEILLDAPPAPDNNDDNTHEFVEIVSANGTSELLDGLSILVVDTQEGSPGAGAIRQVFDLTGLSTGPNGLCVIGDSYNDILLNAPVPFDTSREDPQGLNAGDLSPNEGLTILLIEGFTGTIGTDLDADDDGVFDARPWVALLDGVGFGMVTDPEIAVLAFGDKGADTMARLPESLHESERIHPAAWYGATLTGPAEAPAYGTSHFGPFRGGVTRGYANHAAAPAEEGSVLINEVILEPENEQSRCIEILTTTLDARSLSGYTLVLLDSEGGSVGEIMHLWDLSGMKTGSNGLLLIGEAMEGSLPFAIDDATETRRLPTMKTDDLAGLDAFSLLLVKGIRPIVNEQSDLDASVSAAFEDDGTLDVQPWSAVVDSVGFREYDGDLRAHVGVTYGAADLTQPFEPDVIGRIASPDHLDIGNASSWYGGELAPVTGDPFTIDPTTLFGIEGPAFASPGAHNVGPGFDGGIGDDDDLSDADGDGRPRLLEIATGSDPEVADDGTAFEIRLTREGESTAILLNYHRLPGGTADAEGHYAVSGLRYVLEESEDLRVWNLLPTILVETKPPSSGSSVESATVMMPPPVGGNPEERYIRLRVTRL